MKCDWIWRALSLGCLLTMSTAAMAGGPNLLANPGFEDNGGSYDGWFTFGSGVQLSTPDTENIFRSGQTASKVFGEFAGCPDTPVFSVGGYGQAFTDVSEGRDYEFSGYSFIAAIDPMTGSDTCNSNRMIAKIAFFDATSGGTELSSNEIVIGDGKTAQEAWLPFSVSAPAPAGAQRVEALILFLQPACDPGSVFVDDLNFCESIVLPGPNDLANPSFSSGLSGWNSFGNADVESRAFAVRTTPGSVKMFSTFTEDSPSGIFQVFPASAGSEFKLSGWGMTTCFEGDPINLANDNYVVARIVFRNSTGEEVGSAETVLVDATSPLGTWRQNEVTATAPSGTVVVESFILFISPTLQGGAAFVDDICFLELDATSEVGDGPSIGVDLLTNAPNPFPQTTNIKFQLEAPGHVDVTVIDAAGRRVATLVDETMAAGPQSVSWDGKGVDGLRMPAGVYHYVIRTPFGQTARSMTLIH